MKIQVDSLIRIPPDAPIKLVELLRQRLTLPNPDYNIRSRMMLSTWRIEREFCYLKTTEDGWHHAPRGSVVAKTIKSAIKPEVIDLRATYDRSELICSIELRNYQKSAINALAKNVQGIVQAPCGAGKTILGIGAIAKLGQPTLVLVHTNDLVDQWASAVSKHMGIDTGLIAGGDARAGFVTIATVQSLATLTDDKITALGRGFGCVIVDEAHHVPAETFSRVLGGLAAKYRFGLTATPERADGLTPLLGLAIGETVSSITHEELISAGHLVVPKVVPVRTGCKSGATDHNELLQELSTSPRRNRAIVEMAEGSADDGHSVLILSNRVAHCEVLAEQLHAEALHGKTPRKMRKDILDRFRSGDLKVLCATSLADEGLDVSRLSRLILALPSRAEGRTIQRLGRLMRPHNGKSEPMLFDFIDDHGIAKRQWYARRKAYKSVLGADCFAKEVRL